MPARRLNGQPSAVERFDVLAQSDGTSDLMVHALLCNESRADVSQETVLDCLHMGPPLGAKGNACNAVGSAGLNDAHRRKIKSFVDDRLRERAAEKERQRKLGPITIARMEYRIHPSWSKPSREFPLWRFSCVGFVLMAYKAARIKLIDEPVPSRTLHELKIFYPGHVRHLDDPSARESLGIGVGESSPVELVGYLLNSLAREVGEIHEEPFVPQLGDEYFPPQRPNSST